ncbi:MAG: aldehyde ferredoxin oxidoreductase N-terminal domain-containing protein [Elusimicrobia bacterium]|nr:aldehyde ferredoxin oxidoreductase N-terminal domain-containing protein [Elusimicrobiota bacterium]
MNDIARMKQAHRVLAEFSYEPVELDRGYANRSLRIDLSRNSIETRPVTPQMKELWIGGKGFDLWLMSQEIGPKTRWDSPENPICMSSGPLGGTTSFPGSGKTLATAISPMTDSIIDCNVGGYFGPFLKFAGFDALCLVGKAGRDVLIYIDAVSHRISIEEAPLESVDSHLAAEELTEMYALDELDKRNVAVVSAGRAAEHTRMGVLNFSFYDWRRKTTRLKQAGRGGIGTVFRDKRLKALVIRSRPITPAWRVAESKVAMRPAGGSCGPCAQATREAVREIARKWDGDPDYAIEMLQDIQDRQRHISQAAVDALSLELGVARGQLYHIATFYKAFSLEPRGEAVIQVCVGTACHVKGAAKIVAAFERALGVKQGQTTPDGKFTLEAVACLGCCSLAPVAKIGEEIHGNLRPADVPRIIQAARRAARPAAAQEAGS